MSKDGLVRLPRIDESLRDEFKQDVKDRFGGTKGHYRHEVENALRAYLEGSKGGDTTDRLRRLENAVEQIDERTAALVDGEAGKKTKDSDVSKTTKNRLSQIADVIERESGEGPVHEAVVRQAIEDVAGHSDPTIRRYKQMLTDRRVLHPHPNRDTKFVLGDKEFVKMVQSMGQAGALGNDRYWDLVEHFGGEDTFAEALEEFDVDTDNGDGKRGFQ